MNTLLCLILIHSIVEFKLKLFVIYTNIDRVRLRSSISSTLNPLMVTRTIILMSPM